MARIYLDAWGMKGEPNGVGRYCRELIPLLIVTPLAFLGGSFYSINMLPPFWQKVSLLNPVVYLISGFRWSFYEHSDVSPVISVVMIVVFTVAALGIIAWMFKSGYRLRK